MTLGLIIGIAIGAAFSKAWLAIYNVGKTWVMSKMNSDSTSPK